MTTRQTVTTLLAFFPALFLVANTASAQTLADFARSERNRRATTHSSADPITNETLARRGLLTPLDPAEAGEA